MKRNANGFTLIEIAIVLVIIGLLARWRAQGTGVDHGCAGAQSDLSAGRHQGRVLRLSGPLPGAAWRLCRGQHQHQRRYYRAATATGRIEGSQ